MKPRFASAAMMILLCALPLAAQRVHPSAPPAVPTTDAVTGGGFDFGPCMFVLQLTPDQRAQFKSIMDAAQPTFTTLGNLLKSDHDALDAAAAGTDVCAIGAAYQKVAKDQAAMELAAKILRDKLLTVLTPDQKSRLDGCLAALQNFAPKP